MLAQRLFCLTCALWLGAGANIGSADRSVRELRQGDAPGRVIRPVIPRSPPVRITNAHAGVELLDENVTALNERRRKAASPPDLKKRPFRRARVRRPASRRPSSGPFPAESSVNHRFARKIVEGTLKNVRGGARLISARGNFNVPLVNKLIDNATLIRENIVEGFSCDGRIYGYYADQLNECQIFHICVPMKQMFPNRFTEQDVFHFSFICPKYTIFSQDSMVCAWSQSAVPCSEAHHLYDMNKNFFVVSNDVPKEPPAGGYPSPGGTPTGTSVSFPQYPGSGATPVIPAPSPVAVAPAYPVSGGAPASVAPSPAGVPPAYPVSGGAPASVAPPPAGVPPAYPVSVGAPASVAPPPAGVPPAYPVSGGAPASVAPPPAGVPPAYPVSGGAPVSVAPPPAGVPPAYPVSGGVPVNPAPASTGVPPYYPAPSGVPVNPAPAPVGVPPAYPVSGGTAVNPAPSATGIPPAYPVSGGTAIKPSPAPTGIPPVYPVSGGTAVNPAPAPTGIPPAYPVSGGAAVNLPPAPTGIPPAYPVSGGTAVNPTTASAGIPPAYPSPGGTPVNPAPGVVPVNPAPSPVAASSGYPAAGVVGAGSASGAPLPNSRPLGEGGNFSSTDSVDETTVRPGVTPGVDSSSNTVDSDAPLPNSIPLATNYIPDTDSTPPTNEP